MTKLGVGAMRYRGASQTIRGFLSLHRGLTHTIHALCSAQGPDALKNHAADALQCLIGNDPVHPAHSITFSGYGSRITLRSSDL
ncbi:hypothetical protein [Sinomonas susongensis]|uniref:hypothetical protein n=1 Tax=Sinomonas susongensis TaxID=1324851 RepID=UPI0011099BEB|nr:hypothetical protein [Sinomonas susongensis]